MNEQGYIAFMVNETTTDSVMRFVLRKLPTVPHIVEAETAGAIVYNIEGGIVK